MAKKSIRVYTNVPSHEQTSDSDGRKLLLGDKELGRRRDTWTRAQVRRQRLRSSARNATRDAAEITWVLQEQSCPITQQLRHARRDRWENGNGNGGKRNHPSAT